MKLRDIFLVIGSFLSVLIVFFIYFKAPFQPAPVGGGSNLVCQPGLMTELKRELEILSNTGEAVTLAPGTAVHIVKMQPSRADGAAFHKIDIYIASDKSGRYIGGLKSLDIGAEKAADESPLNCVFAASL